MSRRTNHIDSGDMDFLAIFNPEELGKERGSADVSPDYLLDRAKRVLEKHLPKSLARRDGQAITLTHNGSTIDVVPAIHDGYSVRHHDKVYKIPDGHGGWIRTCPDGINRFLAEANVRSGGQLRTTTRSVKLFTQRIKTGVPIKSIYIELAVAQASATVGAKTKEQAMRDAFCALRDFGCQPIPDPTGVGDPIQAAPTVTKRDVVQTQLEKVASWSTKAVEAREAGNKKEAGRLWNLVFGGAAAA